MKLNGFVGPTYNLDSVNVDCQRCVNLRPEIIESGKGKDGNVIYYKSTPGLTKLFTVGTGPIRLILIDDPKKHIMNPDNRIFIASGSEMYKASFDGDEWTTAKLGDLETAEGEISGIVFQGGDLDLGNAVFVDGEKTYLYWYYSNGDALFTERFGPMGDEYPDYPPVDGATSVLWLDGFFVYLCAGTNQFYVSNWGSVNVDPLSFASSEGDPDKIVGGIVLNRSLLIFNEETTEIWAVSGNADFPFERISGGFIEKGCLAAGSIAKIGGFAFWLGRDKAGQGQVYAASGLNPQRISTYAIEQAISKYENPELAKAYTYSDGGHEYYILNFDEATWVYDLSTKMWHEWAGIDESGNFVRHRIQTSTFFTDYRLNLSGHFNAGDIYHIDPNVYKDDQDYIVRMRIAPHLSAGGKRVFYNSLQIDMETGIGLDGNVQGSDPQMILTWSNDGGHTWSSEVSASAGKKIGGIGDFKKRVKWNRLGSAYDRVFKLKTNEPVPITIIDAEIEIEVGAS